MDPRVFDELLFMISLAWGFAMGFMIGHYKGRDGRKPK
jgi:hypothetical protein